MTDNGTIRIGTPGTHTTTYLTGNIGIDAASPAHKLVLQADDNSSYMDAQQIIIQGNTNNNQQLELGYKTSGNYSSRHAQAPGTRHRCATRKDPARLRPTRRKRRRRPRRPPNKWLELVDAEEYSRAWEAASDAFKDQDSNAGNGSNWSATAGGKPLGK